MYPPFFSVQEETACSAISMTAYWLTISSLSRPHFDYYKPNMGVAPVEGIWSGIFDVDFLDINPALFRKSTHTFFGGFMDPISHSRKTQLSSCI